MLFFNLKTRLTLADLEQESLYGAKNEELNLPLYLTAQRDILKWVRRALDKRAVVVRSIFQDGFQWSVDEVNVLSPLHRRQCRVPRHFSFSSR